ncbi:unnamed protein product [Symbiodinium sp. CCMP2592]|nr:unnamed protein product [Symbiodinium sp. CCMP2592]
MATSGESWWCHRCRLWRKARSQICDQCGAAAATQRTYAGTSWSEDTWDASSWKPGWAPSAQRPRSPRPKSPRQARSSWDSWDGWQNGNAQKGKGQKGGKDKGGKAHGKQLAQELPNTAGPSTSKPSDSQRSSAGGTHRTRVRAVGSTSIPPQHACAASNQQRKLLHHWVTKQTEAKAALSKLAQEQEEYDANWCAYLTKVMETLEHQILDRAKVLGEYAQAEAQWSAQLQDATVQLAQRANGEDGTSNQAHMDVDTNEAAVAEAARIEAKHVIRRERMEEQQSELMQALKKAKEAAEAATVVKEKDRDRTPRRRPKDKEGAAECIEVPDSPAPHASDDFCSEWFATFLGQHLHFDCWLEQWDGRLRLMLDPRVEPVHFEAETDLSSDTARSRLADIGSKCHHRGSTLKSCLKKGRGRKPHHHVTFDLEPVEMSDSGSKNQCAAPIAEFCGRTPQEPSSDVQRFKSDAIDSNFDGQSGEAVAEPSGPVEASALTTAETFRDDDSRQGDARVLCLADMIPEHPKAGVGIVPDMLRDLLLGHDIGSLHLGLPSLDCFHESVSTAFATWLGSRPFDMTEIATVHMYTDGAHYEDTMTGAWALVCAVETYAGEWLWAGSLANPCGENGMTELSYCRSAFTPELLAIIHAMIVSLSCDKVCCIHFDCCSASRVAQGLDASDHVLADVAVGVHELLSRKLYATYFRHEPAHTGVALNEAADKLAKITCPGWNGAACNTMLDEFVSDGILRWLWLCHPSIAADCQWPYICPETGVFACNVDHSTEYCARKGEHEVRSSETGASSEAVDSGCDKHVTVRTVTYNVTTLKGRACRESLAKVFKNNHVQIARLQETRSSQDQVIDVDGYRCYCSAGCDGQFGCEVWIAHGSDWDLSTTAVTVQQPRLVVVTGKCGGQTFAVVSGHAPQSKHCDEIIDQWWQSFFEVMHRIPKDACPIVHLDANARYNAESVEHCVPVNRNALHLDRFRSDFSMCFTGHYDTAGRRLVTWRSPRMKEDVIDYILALARLLRSILKCGRQYRAPRTAPVLVAADGSWITDPSITREMLGEHFAKAERCIMSTEAELQKVVKNFRPSNSVVEDLTDAPAFSDLVRACKSLKNGKAPGLRGIPPEAYNQVPVEAARALYPLQLKMLATGECPRDMRKVWNVAIPKKLAVGVEAWRAVALMEPSMKAIAKSARQRLVPYFRKAFCSGQGGALPGQGLEYPQLLVKSHFRRLRQEHVSGGVLFVDGTSAFYSTVRQYLYDGAVNAEEPHALMDLIVALTPDAAEQARIFAVLTGPSVLEQVHTPDTLRRMIMALLHNTYFVMRREDVQVRASRTGTTPGAPLADLLFAGVFAGFLKDLDQVLQNEGVLVGVADCTDPERCFTAPTATWMDDASLLVRDARPAMVMQHVHTVVRHTHSMRSNP